MSEKMHFGKIVDILKESGDRQNKARRKVYEQTIIRFLEGLMEPIQSGYFTNHLTWASSLPAMIPAFGFKTDFSYCEVSPIVYVGPQKKEHSASRLPFDFDQSHAILSGTHSRLWIWSDDKPLHTGSHKNVLLVYKEFGKNKKIFYHSRRMQNIKNTITLAHMKEFFLGLEKKLLLMKEQHQVTNQ